MNEAKGQIASRGTAVVASLCAVCLAACGGESGNAEGTSDIKDFVGDWSWAFTLAAGADGFMGAQSITITAVGSGLSENFNASADGSGCEIFMATVSGPAATLETVDCNGVTISNGMETLIGDTLMFRAAYLRASENVSGTLTGTCTKA